MVRYLPLTARKTHTGEAQAKWHPIVERLREPEGSAAAITLGTVLSTPLMVALARAGISDTQADPAELWDIAAEPGGDADRRLAR